MSEWQPRKYSLAEIDQMRRSIGWSYSSAFSYNPVERNADVENRLRTYMQNGTDPAELEEMARQHMAREREAQQRLGSNPLTIVGTLHRS